MKRNKLNFISGYLLIFVLILIWELISRLSENAFFPSFTRSISALVSSIIKGDFLSNVYISIIHSFFGLFIAMLLMIPLGFYIGRSKSAHNLFNPLIEFLRPLPSSAIIPLAIVYLGFEAKMKIFVIVFGCSWPILLNTINAVKNIEPMYLKTAHSLKFNWYKRFIHVLWPASLPSILTGVKISLAISLILTITVEMVVGSKGIGYYIIDNERSFKFPEMYGGILFLGFLGIIINKSFLYIENKLISWQYE